MTRLTLSIVSCTYTVQILKLTGNQTQRIELPGCKRHAAVDIPHLFIQIKTVKVSVIKFAVGHFTNEIRSSELVSYIPLYVALFVISKDLA